MKKIAVILSGCGVFDGAECNEVILSLLAIEQQDAKWDCFAPDKTQHHVLNHHSGEEIAEPRNVMVEAGRLVRGSIAPLSTLDANDYDALLVPGGFGVAKNLSDFAFKGAECQLDPDFKRATKAFASAEKPAGYLCIAPALLPLIYGPGVKATLGNDDDEAVGAFTQLGGEHVACPVNDFVLDQSRRLLSSPAYMLAGSIKEAQTGISKLVEKLVALA
ncbi:isoprenoid biosynthesis glyoxalase ElbB [Thaumasiovibrio subtropicus]|uniref:isoprenoid biosynthesis glyoxalase ElbB n=1 Tax=Thaumasiovibrio subtropicus TaxID=1891207 RepID=UPI000B355D93|nr:isoprenoid biosynthesis glyoxalase ElbB [Thaumasiovibrio subtropicus]